MNAPDEAACGCKFADIRAEIHLLEEEGNDRPSSTRFVASEHNTNPHTLGEKLWPGCNPMTKETTA